MDAVGVGVGVFVVEVLQFIVGGGEGDVVFEVLIMDSGDAGVDVFEDRNLVETVLGRLEEVTKGAKDDQFGSLVHAAGPLVIVGPPTVS
jgi:hypothetical protein